MKRKEVTTALAIMLALVGCDSSTEPGSGVPVSLSLVVPAATSPALALPAAPAGVELFAAGELPISQELTLTAVQVTLAEVELELAGSESGCDDDEGELEGSEFDSCEEMHLGPVTLDLNLDGMVAEGFVVIIEPGFYDEFEYEIVGVNVEYTWDGESGTFTATLDAEVEQEFPPPGMEITTGDNNLTLSVDVKTWFIAADGTTVIDPSTALAGGANESQVRNNIVNSFDGFEDDDRDGVPHDEDDDEKRLLASQ